MFRRSSQSLPADLSPVFRIDLSKDMGLLLRLNAAGLVGLLAAGWGLTAYLQKMRPGEFDLGLLLTPVGAAGMVAALVVMVVLHEAVHGALFWLFTGRRPQVGIGPYYAYAAARGWYIPRREYTLIGLAPLVVLTWLGLVMLRGAPDALLPGMFVFVVMNAAGSVGDIYIIYTVWRHRSGILIEDLGDGFVIFDRMKCGDI